MPNQETSGDYLTLADFIPPQPDRLGVLAGTAHVMRAARHVRIHRWAAEALAARWAGVEWPGITATLGDLHQPGAPQHAPNWVLLLDALNFCFWGAPNGPRWRVTWHGATHDGYNALAAALSRAVEDGIPVWDADWLASLDAGTLADVLRPDEGCPPIPLFAERLSNVTEAGRALRERYEGQFANVVEDAGYNAVKLALTVEREFPSFADIATWRNTTVPFLKRAQILVADLRAIMNGAGVGAIRGTSQLTAFADYKLPQRLRSLGVLAYDDELAQMVDSYTLIPAGSEIEIEIRAATVWAVEALRRGLATRGVNQTAAAIDERIWVESQTHLPDERPYHRTRTIYY